MPAAKAAARFIFLNRNCFNGLYRTNLKGLFNVPYAPTGTGKVPSEEALLACSDALRNAKILHGDFEATIAQVRQGDFVYLDPPFAVHNRRVFREYHPNAFSTADIPRLTRLLSFIDKSKAHFLASYADCSQAREAFARWNVNRVRAKRNIAGFSKSRRYAYELIVTNIKAHIPQSTI